LHSEAAYLARDIGQYPYYKNGRTVLSRDFRYFGDQAQSIPDSLWALQGMADALGQGHRVFLKDSPETADLDHLFKQLWRKPTRHTPSIVLSESRGHTPRP
jgi:hypothetical protein